MIKTLSKVGIQGVFLNIIKAIYERPTANIILNAQNLELSHEDQEQDKDVHFTTSIQHSAGSPSHSNQTKKKTKRKEIKGIQIGKEEVKLSLFAGDVIAVSYTHLTLPTIRA